MSDADGACTRAKVNSLLAQRFGKVVGYKAGLTNPAVQKRFNTDKPVGQALRRHGAGQRRGGGCSLWCPPTVRGRHAGAREKRPDQPGQDAHAGAGAIDQVIPFIELPDLLVQAPPKLNGAGVSAINVGAVWAWPVRRWPCQPTVQSAMRSCRLWPTCRSA